MQELCFQQFQSDSLYFTFYVLLVPLKMCGRPTCVSSTGYKTSIQLRIQHTTSVFDRKHTKFRMCYSFRDILIRPTLKYSELWKSLNCGHWTLTELIYNSNIRYKMLLRKLPGLERASSNNGAVNIYSKQKAIIITRHGEKILLFCFRNHT